MNRLIFIIQDIMLVVLVAFTKLMPARVRESILDFLLHPVNLTSLQRNREAKNTVHIVKKIE